MQAPSLAMTDRIVIGKWPLQERETDPALDPQAHASGYKAGFIIMLVTNNISNLVYIILTKLFVYI